ncbi:hypothetical protein [Thalassotalea crassostreae]|uniref:hypothetical protein n=1 Tax=Thalassotalea crassostreae TaxID=1763536 RepID=UPI0008396ABA|nr:hypothetical protein [Thalassotalea crassostreae]
MNNSIAPKWFVFVAVFALIWNLLGVAAFFFGPTMNADAMASLPQAQQDIYAATPFWAVVAFAIAVCGGALGSLLLVLKNALAKPVLMASLAAIIVQMFHAYFLANSWEVFGPGGTIMPIMVIIIAIGLVWLSCKAKENDWIS